MLKYIKVLTADRLPDKEGKYLCKVYGYSNYEHYAFIDGKFKTSFVIEEYLEPVPDREDELKAILQTYIEEFKAFNFSAETFKRAEQILKELK